MSIERVGVIGAGQMGSGIAEVSAKAGANVAVYEPTEELITAGRNRIAGSLDRAASKGKLSESDRDAALARLTFTTATRFWTIQSSAAAMAKALAWLFPP